MAKIMRQRRIKEKDTVMVGTRVDSQIHAIIKDTATHRGVSMATVIEEALNYYINEKLSAFRGQQK